MSRLNRSSAGRTAKDYTVVVSYDGERTEDDYFRGWQQVLPPDRITLLPIFVRSGGNPLKAIKESKKIKASLGGHAEFWCVCDVDGATPANIAEATALANASDIRICLSNRCFETWISLHFRMTTAPILCEDDAIRLVARDVPGYGAPYKTINFFDLFERTGAAIQNGIDLERRGTVNPSTKLHHLVRKLHQNLP